MDARRVSEYFLTFNINYIDPIYHLFVHESFMTMTELRVLVKKYDRPQNFNPVYKGTFRLWRDGSISGLYDEQGHKLHIHFDKIYNEMVLAISSKTK